jgi:hypothetical protein
MGVDAGERPETGLTAPRPAQAAGKPSPTVGTPTAPVRTELERLSRENLVSLVLVASGRAGVDADEARMLSDYADVSFDYFEIVIVAAAPDRSWVDEIRDVAQDLSQARVVILDSRMSYEELAIAALHHAIGDVIVCVYPGEIGTGEISEILAELATGEYEIVKFVHDPQYVPWISRLGARLAGSLISAMTGKRLTPFQARAFGMTRTAATRLLGIGGALKYFRIIDLEGRISEHRIPLFRSPKRNFLDAANVKARLVAELVSLSAERLVITLALLCVLLSLGSLLFMIGAVLIKYMMENVAPGWTSLAVLFSAFSAANFGVLGTICLGILQIIRQGRPPDRGGVATEISGGDLFRRPERGNVEISDVAGRAAQEPETDR